MSAIMIFDGQMSGLEGGTAGLTNRLTSCSQGPPIFRGPQYSIRASFSSAYARVGLIRHFDISAALL